MKWNIINSIDLAKIYPITETKLFITDDFSQKLELIKFFNSFQIPYYTNTSQSSINETIYFGSNIDFRSLYVLAGIVKSYGFKQMTYKSSLNEKITFGSIKRKTISSNNISVPIDEILDLPFDTSFYEFSIKFNLSQLKKIDLDEYYLEQGWQVQKTNETLDFNVEKIDSEENEDGYLDIDELFKKYKTNDDTFDPHENFRWGGLSGEEAYIGYLNTD